MHRGYVKYWRKIKEWSWYKSPITKSVFLHLLAESNIENQTFLGYEIQRGQIVCGRKHLAETLGISEDQVRTALTRLKSTNDITIRTTNRFSIISIVNYEFYQSKIPNKIPKNSPNRSPTDPQQIPTIKECKNEKNEKKYREATPQTLEETKLFFKSLGNESYAEEFFDFYASKGWVIGRSPMKDWKCAARRWFRNQWNYKTKEQKNESGIERVNRIADEARRKTILTNT